MGEHSYVDQKYYKQEDLLDLYHLITALLKFNCFLSTTVAILQSLMIH